MQDAVIVKGWLPAEVAVGVAVAKLVAVAVVVELAAAAAVVELAAVAKLAVVVAAAVAVLVPVVASDAPHDAAAAAVGFEAASFSWQAVAIFASKY